MRSQGGIDSSTVADLLACADRGCLFDALRSPARAYATSLGIGAHIEVADLPPKAADWATEFFDRFADQEPQLADAMLIYLAEQNDISTVFTLDRRDFLIYRLADGRALSILD